jgi:nucleoside phosphorylase
MKIGLLSATLWEVRPALRSLGLLPSTPRVFEREIGEHSVSLRLSGMGQERAKRAALSFIGASPRLLIATGFCGSLKENVKVGDLVLDKGKSDARYADTLVQAARKLEIPCHVGAFYTSQHLLTRAIEKQRLGDKSGALAVEMESQPIFEALRRRGISLLFVRSVSDGVHQNLPDVSDILGENGQLRSGLLSKILFKPSQLANFIHLGIGSRKAGASLARILKEFIDHV